MPRGSPAAESSATLLSLLASVTLFACSEDGAHTPSPAATPDGPAPQSPALESAVAVVAVEAVNEGRRLFFGPAACGACHSVNAEGTMIVGPNLGVCEDTPLPIKDRAKLRRPDLTPIEYVIESILDPDAVVVEGYAAGVMKSLDDLPQDISDENIVSLAAFCVSDGHPEKLTEGDLEAARARIPIVRAARLPSKP